MGILIFFMSKNGKKNRDISIPKIKKWKNCKILEIKVFFFWMKIKKHFVLS